MKILPVVPWSGGKGASVVCSTRMSVSTNAASGPVKRNGRAGGGHHPLAPGAKPIPALRRSPVEDGRGTPHAGYEAHGAGENLLKTARA